MSEWAELNTLTPFGGEIRDVVGDIERRFEAWAAYDKRHPDPSKNYGIHGVEMRWVIRGPRGATQFKLFTGWLLPETVGVTPGDWRSSWTHRYADALDERYPSLMPADLGYHAYEPQYEGQDRMDSCDILTDAEGGCYYDGSGLNAERPFLRLLREGNAGVWAELWDYYESLFHAKEPA